MNTQKNLIKIVASFAPWLAPAPSAYFVARSAGAHLDVPWYISIIIAAVVETLGVASVHTALWLHDWNTHKRRTDPSAPVIVATALGVVYMIATVGLTVVLEVAPNLSVIAPALFPTLAVVGAIDLALISQQENRESISAQDKAERSAQRHAQRHAHGNAHTSAQAGAQIGAYSPNIYAINEHRKAQKSALLVQLLSAYQANPGLGATEAGRQLGLHRNTIRNYTLELEGQGRIKRNGDGVEVVA